ncbi:MAG: hypothetical protein WC241_05270 [Candidatus Paceibacterota bacterium]|jgi:putative transposase
MGLRKISFVEGEYYHIYNRGNSKQKIFLDDKDFEHFIKLLYLCNSINKINFREDIVEKKIDAWDFERKERIVSIGSWVLMPNHFHLYVVFPKGLSFGKDQENKNNISTFMSKLCTSYTMYFNKKHNRTGSLFEGKFKSVNVIDDIQAKYLFSYIHLNPIKLIQSDWKEKGIYDSAKAITFLDSYKWSSYLDFLNIKRKENLILNEEDFPDFFSTKEKFKKEIFEWIETEEELD